MITDGYIPKNDFGKIPESEKGKGKFNRTAKIGGWRNNFDSDEQKLMISIMGKTLEELNYEL